MKTYKCICCSKEIKLVNSEFANDTYPEENMWEGGTVDLIYMPFGSRLDSNKYRIAICDDCVEQKAKDGIIEQV